MVGFGSSANASTNTERIIVGVGQMEISKDPNVTLSAYALGSCIAVCAYDPIVKVGGILNVMLPDSKLSEEKSKLQPLIFADTGVKEFVLQLKSKGAHDESLKMGIAGGANPITGSDAFKIGHRNSEAVEELMASMGLSLKHKDTGGMSNRTVHLKMQNGLLDVCVLKEKKEVSLG